MLLTPTQVDKFPIQSRKEVGFFLVQQIPYLSQRELVSPQRNDPFQALYILERVELAIVRRILPASSRTQQPFLVIVAQHGARNAGELFHLTDR